MARPRKESERPAKRARLLSGGESDSDDSEAQSSRRTNADLKINPEFARRFEHNKKREELQRLEEKYGKASSNTNGHGEALDDEEDDESSETDDDEGALATAELDGEVMDVLKAIKSKDPRVYDKQSVFYKSLQDEQNDAAAKDVQKGTKPVHLRDYHRRNLLEGQAEQEDEDDDDRPKPYFEEQASLKRDLLKQMHEEAQEASDEEDFLVKKPGQDVPKKRKEQLPPEPDVAEADKDPEGFLENLMTSRAWVDHSSSKFRAFDSDDESDEARAEAFEEAYNLRFEDPARANEKLLTHSREAAAKYSVRQEDVKGRKKVRERERSKKDEEKRERNEEKARLRKLKVDEAHEKLKKFKQAAGLRGKNVSDEEWAEFLNAGFDSGKWDEEMRKRFDDQYYGAHDEDMSDGESAAKSGIKKVKKPKWDDDIDIGDIVPDFDEEEEGKARAFTLSDDEESDGGVALEADAGEDESVETAANGRQKKTKKDAEQKRREQKRQARVERAKIEELVDSNMASDMTGSRSRPAAFRYRETSPSAFGLSARDILMADDSQLNAFAGLKKMAAFRDEEKKRKDRKKLGKKARLRQWRKDTFGDEEGPRQTFQEYMASQARQAEDGQEGVRAGSLQEPGDDGQSKEKKKKKKKKTTRSRKRKAGEEASV